MPKLKLKAQLPQVKIEAIAKAPDVDDVFFPTFKRYGRKLGLEHYHAMQKARVNSTKQHTEEGKEKAFQSILSLLNEHLIQVELTDADGAKHVLKGDDITVLYDSTPYILALLDACEEALDNVKKQEDSQMGNLNVLATLLQAQKDKASTTTH